MYSVLSSGPQISKSLILMIILLAIFIRHDPEDEVKTVILLGDKDVRHCVENLSLSLLALQGAVTVMITDNILNAFTLAIQTCKSFQEYHTHS